MSRRLLSSFISGVRNHHASLMSRGYCVAINTNCYARCQQRKAVVPTLRMITTHTSSDNKVNLGIREDASLLISEIKKELQTGRSELTEIATYYFDGEGKAYRPMIVLLIGRAFNHHMGCPIQLSQAQRVVAMVAEMIHTSSLVHDDVIDCADTRRGKPSVNVLYGQRRSVLAGDYILSRASQMLAKLENEDIIVVLSHILLDLVRGEFMQMNKAGEQNQRFDNYISKSFKKTASLIAYTCKAVTLLSGADAKQQEAAYEYGRNLGIAFQLIDDLLDFESNQTELGKPTAADLKLGLATAPVLYASAQFEELEAMISRRFSEPGDVERSYELVMKSDGLEKTRELARRHAQDALDHISGLSDSDEKRELFALAEMTVNRRK
ncbi:Decaprenyl-diphosphate synthase subunit 1 [Fragariocoptes setiger]|uniref:Decaprenyl-diphosphate synthase subunit 1 n=1 Tax=Fragariocoptes setiger TaxID=1670756 RepID=A0ABQ7SBB9_9ACAR|nr:Decaprenyl-diphosphate synthase subunit 1 [Fragariocoptes setiger]